MTEGWSRDDIAVICFHEPPTAGNATAAERPDGRGGGGSETESDYFSSGFCLPSSKNSTSVFLPLLL